MSFYSWFVGFLLLVVLGLYFCKPKETKEKTTVVIEKVVEIPHIPKKSLFNSDYLNGDTACFELVDDSTIRLKCVCSCEQYKKKEDVQ